ncbi:hypothetical protein UY3_16655 [Chelonia mydas]|uniref:Uncharacterized protein n=1 Tax=Chelonia mydas TaxID=8469 RepID=M7BDE3_CHEMY|nr:hypothetical protein UY3_16655 [Chelonia mydas]
MWTMMSHNREEDPPECHHRGPLGKVSSKPVSPEEEPNLGSSLLFNRIHPTRQEISNKINFKFPKAHMAGGIPYLVGPAAVGPTVSSAIQKQTLLAMLS